MDIQLTLSIVLSIDFSVNSSQTLMSCSLMVPTREELCLPYVGELATNKFARQIRRLIAKIAPCVELRLVFRAAQKLSCLTRLKSKLNVLSRSGVVYQISCSQCEAFYVGKTKHRLEQRVQEHSQQGYSSWLQFL